MIILDTNVVSELMKPRPDDSLERWLLGLGDAPVATTLITLAEITYGLHRLPPGRRRSGLEARFESLLEDEGALAILEFGQEAARNAGTFRAMRVAAGRNANPSDMLIAGSVAAAGGSLATRNASDFELLPINVVDPWQF
jgi:predicted nucleic acid-binding protein